MIRFRVRGLGIAAASSAILSACGDKGAPSQYINPVLCADGLPCAASPVAVTSEALFTALTVGAEHSCALALSGEAYCWGGNGSGQLGSGESQTHSSVPVLVAGGRAYVRISAGAYHTCALTDAGDGFCWGRGSSGALGSGLLNETCGAFECSRVPVQVIGGHAFGEIDAGYTHTCAVNVSREAYCWGSNEHGELGTGLYYGGSALPERVMGDDAYLSVVAGTQYSCGITEAGLAKCWGSADSDVLGSIPPTFCPEPEEDERCSPEPLHVATSEHFSRLSAGDRHICGLSANLAILCWGDNAMGQMGLTGVVRTYVPTMIEGPAGAQLIEISAGGQHSCAITSGFETYCWGSNRAGQLGGGILEAGPFVAHLVDGGLVFAAVRAGGKGIMGHTCGLTPERRVYCWGSREFGQIGDGK